MSVLSLFDIGRTSLLATRKALDTIAHNVANASTPGYSRQEVMLENIPPGVIAGTGTTGRGVKVTEVKRMYDSFTSLQLRSEKSNLSYWSAYEKGIIKIENVFNEASDTGITTAITDFFNAWQEVSQNPEGYAQRTVLLKKAEYLSSRISRSFISLDDSRTEIYKSSQSLVDEVNSIAAKIAGLNEKIAITPGSLDLKDQRDNLLERLNQILKVTTFEDNVGRYTILISGTPLVDAGKVYNMSVSTDTANNMHFYVNLPYETRDVTSYITGGELKANLDLRDSKILGYMNRLNAFAIDLMDTINYYHKQGYGLDSSTGSNFFSSTASITDPSGGGVISSVSITNANTFNYDRYRIAYTYDGTESSGDYVVTDLTTGTTVASVAYTLDSGGFSRTLEFNGIKVRIDGDMSANETFEVQLNQNAAREMAVSITDPQKIASSVDTFEINSSNNTIEFNVGGPSLFATISQGTYTAAELAAALKSALEAADGVANTYTVVYNPIIKRFKLINDAGGASTINLLWTAGGTTAEQIFGFTADSSIAVGSYDVSDNSVSSYAANALPGDNRNAKTIADLINQTVIAGSTPVDFYRSMVSDVGVEALSAKQSLKFQDALVDELERRRQEFSGVSLDEEAANLIKYQKMFEASAKMISVADELLSILMNMTGRR